MNRCSSPWKMADGEQYTTMCGGVVTSSVRRRCCIKANHLKVRFIFNLRGQLKKYLVLEYEDRVGCSLLQILCRAPGKCARSLRSWRLKPLAYPMLNKSHWLLWLNTVWLSCTNVFSYWQGQVLCYLTNTNLSQSYDYTDLKISTRV